MTKVPMDQAEDRSQTGLHKLVGLYPPPPYVKAAAHRQICGDPSLPDQVYAYPAKKLYPSHTKAATWTSAGFFQMTRAYLKPEVAGQVEGALRKLAAYHQILPDVEALWAKMAADANADLAVVPDTHFAMVWKSAMGETQRKYPLRNRAEVKRAAEWFVGHRHKFRFGDRRKVANKIMSRAEDLNLHLENESEVLTKAAGYGSCSRDDVAAAWERRADLVRHKHADWANVIEGIVRTVKSSSIAYDLDSRYTMAETMEDFDRKAGLNVLYENGGLARPEDVLFQVTEKAANDFLQSHIRTATGRVYEKQALAERVHPDKIREWMGDDFTNEVTVGGLFLDTEKLSECLSSLPKPDAVLFERMLSAQGISPVVVEKAATAFGFAEDELRELATAL